MGEDPGMCMTVGESVSAPYCGVLVSRVMERRAAVEEEGHCRWCLLARLELFESEDAVERRLEAPLRCGGRGALLMPGRSPVRPTIFPISVEVRSIDMTPGPADERRSGFPPALYACWPVGLLMADMLEARDVRPLPLGSRSVSIELLSMRAFSVKEEAGEDGARTANEAGVLCRCPGAIERCESYGYDQKKSRYCGLADIQERQKRAAAIPFS